MKARKPLYFIVVALLVTILAGCEKHSEYTVPAFLHLDGIALTVADENPVVPESELYTSDIVGVRILLHYPGRSTLDTLGVFELPLTVPVLYDGTVDRIEVVPTIEQSGSSRALIPYHCYEPIYLTGKTLHAGDTLNLGILQTHYKSTIDVKKYEIFEPTQGSIIFDSTMIWEKHDPAGACTGDGYGRLPVSSNEVSKTVAMNYDFTEEDASKALYLELDSRSDLLYSVNMVSSVTNGSATETQEVMRIRPSDGWVHLYVNLGRTWRWFNYHKDFRITFTVLNPNGEEGELRLDNVRLISAVGLI